MKQRVLRIIEYVGTPEFIEKQLNNSIHGTKTLKDGIIKVATIGAYPEILNELSEGV